MGLLCYDENHYKDAEAYYLKALSQISGYSACHNNYAILLHKMDRHREAAEQYQLALQCDPRYHQAQYGLITVLAHLNQLDQAEQLARDYLIKVPDDSRCQNALGMLLLRKGQFEEGWQYYRARYAETNPDKFFKLPDFPFRYWNGEDLSGKTILIQREQGLGDEIQFCRYVTRLKQEKHAEKVILVCRENLIPLFSTLPNIDLLLTSWNDAKPAVDYWCMLLDLPQHFISAEDPFISARPYLSAPPAEQSRWNLPEGRPQSLKVAVVWRGSPDHLNDRHRSLPSLTTLKPLWANHAIQWVSLQKGAGEQEALHPAADQPVIALGHLLNNFSDTAAVIEQMDLIITVDTSVAHLAGAMGKTCWVMLPAIGTDWRWTLRQETSLWYPGMRLFHRLPGEGCDALVMKVDQKLKAWINHQLEES